MIIRVCAFTLKGRILANKVSGIFSDDIVEISEETDVDIFVKRTFEIKCPLLFIGACGIAVRKIAPYVSNKLTDSPVVVIDEAGKYVIPILSGHMGGANVLAKIIADYLDAECVITTATDVEGVFSIDLFAKDNHLGIVNKEGIKKVSAKVLLGEKLTVDIDDNGTDRSVDVIISDNRKSNSRALLSLYPKRYFLGVGCRKNTPYEQIESLVCKVLDDNNIGFEDVAQISSIDIKKKEYGLNEFAHRHNIELKFYSANELMKVRGDFSTSEFVKEITGVDNVCERAALISAGLGGQLVAAKTIGNGVTAALAYDPNPISVDIPV